MFESFECHFGKWKVDDELSSLSAWGIKLLHSLVASNQQDLL